MADPKHPRKFSEELKRQIVQLYDNGKSPSEIQAEFDNMALDEMFDVFGITRSLSKKGCPTTTRSTSRPTKRSRRSSSIKSSSTAFMNSS